MAPRYPIALFLLLFLAIPAFPLIRTGAERELTARQIDVAAFSQTNAHIATDGSSFLTVWEDAGGGGILGARLDANGGVVDETPLVIATNGALPEIAWGGGRYLAVWQHTGGMSGRFIERDGTMREPFLIGTYQLYSPIETHLAFNGTVFLALWFNARWHGRIIDQSGTPGAGVSIPDSSTEGDLAALGGTFYLACRFWNDAVPVYTPRLVTIDGGGRTSAPMDIGKANVLVEKMRIAARPDDLLVAWTTSRGQELNDVRITTAGAGPVESIPVPFKWMEHIVVDEFDYWIVYGDNNQKLARRPGLSPLQIAAPPRTTMSDAATGSTRVVTILQYLNQFDTIGSDLYLQNFGETTLRPLEVAPRHQESPDIAAAGDVKLAVWLETMTGERTRTVFARRFDAAGNPLDAQPIALGSTFNPHPVRVASNGTGWLVVWRNDGYILAARVAHDGTLLDPVPLKLNDSQAQSPATVAWDGSTYVVTYTAGVKVFFAILYAVRVPATGNPGQPFVVERSVPVLNAAIAGGPNGALIVWNYSNQVRGALLSQGDVITPIAFQVPYGYVTSVAWNRDTFLVAMKNGAPLNPTVSWFTVDAFGNVVTAPPPIDTLPAIAWTHASAFEDGFLLLWNDPELHAAITGRDGKIVSGPVVIGSSTNSAAAVDGWILTAHTIGHPSRLITRVFLQTLELVANARRRSVR
jgi:hypothetical protein